MVLHNVSEMLCRVPGLREVTVDSARNFHAEKFSEMFSGVLDKYRDLRMVNDRFGRTTKPIVFCSEKSTLHNLKLDATLSGKHFGWEKCGKYN